MKMMTFLKRQNIPSNQQPLLTGLARSVVAYLCLTPTLFVPVAMAQSIERSWFEIELLAFSRDNNQPLLEQFPAKVSVIKTKGSEDLLSSLYLPDLTAILLAAPACQKQQVFFANDPELSLDIAQSMSPLFAADDASLVDYRFQQSKFNLPLSDSINLPDLCPFDVTFDSRRFNPSSFDTTLPGAVQISQIPPAQLPVTPQGQELHQATPYLAPENALQLKDLAYQLKHRGGHQLLLHTAWRQQLASKRKAQPYRWFAGINFGQQFDYFGKTKANASEPASDSAGQLLQQINSLEKALQQNPTSQLAELQPDLNQQNEGPVWQLDGLIKVYSERMLFAETEFNLRRLSADGSKLSTYYSNDQTRLLIGEVHYLDHPYLGLVLQIRRFTPPLLPVAEADTAATTTPP
jgi:hypothetical protein